MLAAAESEFEIRRSGASCRPAPGRSAPGSRSTGLVRADPLAARVGGDRAGGGEPAAHAILTTDTRTKQAAVRVRLHDGVVVRVGGMAKGSGMIAPRLAPPHATTLAYLTTDARASPRALETLLVRGVSSSFNMITVDGDMSTNDTVYLLANGAAGGELADRDPAFAEAIDSVLRLLARQVARDGEGATKLFTVNVTGAHTVADARAARPRGRRFDARQGGALRGGPERGTDRGGARCTPARLDPDRIDVLLERPRGALPLITHGRPARTLENGGGMRIRDLLRQLDEVPITVRLHAGSARATAWGCDLSYAYVQINAAYRT